MSQELETKLKECQEAYYKILIELQDLNDKLDEVMRTFNKECKK